MVIRVGEHRHLVHPLAPGRTDLLHDAGVRHDAPVSFRDRVALVGRESPHGQRQPAQFRNMDLPLPMSPSTSTFWLQFLHLLPQVVQFVLVVRRQADHPVQGEGEAAGDLQVGQFLLHRLQVGHCRRL